MQLACSRDELYTSLYVQKRELYLALIYYDWIWSSNDALVGVVFMMVLEVIIVGLCLGHFYVIRLPMLSIQGIQLSFRQVIHNPSTVWVTHHIDRSTETIPKIEKKYISEWMWVCKSFHWNSYLFTFAWCHVLNQQLSPLLYTGFMSR